MKKLVRNEMRSLKGGEESTIGGGGTCTYTYSGVSCSSSTGDCKNLYCSGGGSPGRQFGVCCDGTQYAIAGGSGECSGLGGTLCCDA